MTPLRKKTVPTCVPDASVKSAAVSPAVSPSPWEDDTETLLSEPTTPVDSASESENVFSSSPASLGRKGCCVTLKHNKPKKSYWFIWILLLIVIGAFCEMSGQNDIDSAVLREMFRAGTPLLDERELFPSDDDQETVLSSPILSEVVAVDETSPPEPTPEQPGSSTKTLIVASPSSVVQDVAAPPVPSMASRVEVLPVTSQPPDAVVPSASADVEASVVFAPPPALLTNWKFAFASVLHLTFKHLCLKMGAPVTAEDVDYLLRLVPADIQTYQPTFIILMALQAVLNTPG